MSDMKKQLQRPDVGSILRFFDVQYRDGNSSFEVYLHNNGMTEQLDAEVNRIVGTPIMQFNGREYTNAGISMEGMKLSDSGKVNSPLLVLANEQASIPNYVSTMCRMYGDLRGAKVTAYFTTEQAYRNNTGQYMTQTWYIEQITSEAHDVVKFMLKSPLDFRRQRIPTRIISPLCAWAMRGDYRGEECGYTGIRYFDAKGNPVSDPRLDDCGGRCSDCELRFGKGARLSFGGMLTTYTNGNT